MPDPPRADPRHRGELFAERGFHGVSVVELGAACGISGPALYKHFASKDAMLAEMLVAISERAAQRRPGAVGGARPTRAAALRALVAWHVDFALHHKPLIVLQDRDWSSLPDDARERVRSLQRRYVDLWADRLREVHADLTPRRARAMAHATFGLLNSTPHSAMLPEPEMASMLERMACGPCRSDRWLGWRAWRSRPSRTSASTPPTRCGSAASGPVPSGSSCAAGEDSNGDTCWSARRRSTRSGSTRCRSRRPSSTGCTSTSTSAPSTELEAGSARPCWTRTPSGGR